MSSAPKRQKVMTQPIVSRHEDNKRSTEDSGSGTHESGGSGNRRAAMRGVIRGGGWSSTTSPAAVRCVGRPQERVCAHARAISLDDAWPLRRAPTTARRLCSCCLVGTAFVERLAHLSLLPTRLSVLVCAGSFTEPNLPIAAKCTYFISLLHRICRVRTSLSNRCRISECRRGRRLARGLSRGGGQLEQSDERASGETTTCDHSAFHC
jgi:hypothetical protein